VSAAIGNAAVMPVGVRSRQLVSELGASGPTFVMVAVVAAFYLQSNYEKDRAGDAVAGYRTLAVVLGTRYSAVVRAVAITAIALAADLLGLLDDGVSRVAMVLALGAGLFSTLGPILRGTDGAALSAYRWAVHASVLAMMSLGVGALGPTGSLVAAFVAMSLTEWAFRRSANP
jgi:hypothetical protein